jgi:hypothetical protein
MTMRRLVGSKHGSNQTPLSYTLQASERCGQLETHENSVQISRAPNQTKVSIGDSQSRNPNASSTHLSFNLTPTTMPGPRNDASGPKADPILLSLFANRTRSLSD